MQNFIFISPNFPTNYWQFCHELKNNGMNVLGIGDQPYDAQKPEMKDLSLIHIVQYFKDYSPALGRDMECKIYGHAGRPMLYIPCQLSLIHISSDNQREESIEGQIRECTAYAEKNGFTVVKHLSLIHI